MDRTVEYNIMLALSMYDLSDEEKESRIDYVLKAVNMLRNKKRMVSQLSGGQQQRVAIARALVKSPKVIFADEPTGNLDEANTMNIMGILKKISKECLVVIVTHEKAIAEFFADKILWISDGQIEKEEDRESNSIYQYIDDSNLYLQEFSKKEIKSRDVVLEIYGDMENQKRILQHCIRYCINFKSLLCQCFHHQIEILLMHIKRYQANDRKYNYHKAGN